MKRRIWTAIERAELIGRYPHELTAPIAKDLGRPVHQLHAMAAKLGLHKRIDVIARIAHDRSTTPGHGSHRTRFPKGQKPFNTGRRGIDGKHPNSRATQFKPGQVSKRWDPEIYAIGALRIDGDGYLAIKVRLGGYRPGDPQWVQMHRYVWAQTFGPIPEGMTVRARDGDLMNTNIENLYLASRVELMRENTLHNLPKPLARLVQLRGAVNRQINRRQKEREQQA